MGIIHSGKFAAILGLLLSGASLAADIDVDTTVDESDGSCSDGDCSIRDAIAVAASGDRILVPAGTYALSLGALEPTVSMEIIGAGAQDTIIDGGGATKVFLISGALDVSMASLTVTNGTATGTGRGGGIHSIGANLTLRDCVVSDSTGFNGGGVVGDGGSLFIERCAILDNLADGNSGGGILSNSSDLTLLDSTVSGNSAPASSRVGGGIGVFGSLPGRGFELAGNVLIRNSTIVGNDAEDAGGGIYMSPGVGALVTISNSVIADNAGGDCSEAVTSLGYNLDSDGSCGLGATGDLSATAPDLGALALNGGQTPNFLPNASSPLVDAGNPAPADSGDASCTATDQRGFFPPPGTVCDIGSTELNGAPDPGPTTPAVPVPTLSPSGVLVLLALMFSCALVTTRRTE